MTTIAAPYIEEEVTRHRSHAARQRLTKGSVGMLNIVPMLDILFNLLIFFLCFGLVMAPEGALPAKLPASHGQAPGTMPLTPIEIRLEPTSGAGGVRIVVRPQNVQTASMIDLYALMVTLRDSRDFGVEAPVILLPGPDVSMAFVADAYNAAFQAGFKEIVFGEKNTEEGGSANAQ